MTHFREASTKNSSMLFFQPAKKIDTEYFRYLPKYLNHSQLAPVTSSRTPSISLVTRCMNRLHDLKETLPKNIQDNADYSNLEFVVVDYGSTDNLEQWVKSEMMPHIKTGRLSFYRTTEPENFCPNHSQNLTFRVAKNEIVANVDSDNFTHAGYATRIAQCLSIANDRVIAVPENFLLPDSKRLKLKGRFAVYRSDVDYLGGFDEDLDEGFGNDDVSFVLRAMFAGFQISRFESRFTEGRLETEDQERTLLVKNKDFKAILMRNGEITWNKLARGIVQVNRNRHWGKANVVKNFSERLSI